MHSLDTLLVLAWAFQLLIDNCIPVNDLSFTKQKMTAILNTVLKDHFSGQNCNGNNCFTLAEF